MAIFRGDCLASELKKLVGKKLVIKQYEQGIVVTKFPDMSQVKPSKKQKQERNKFKEAVAYAQTVLHDAKKKKAYQKKVAPNQTVYHFALKEYLQSA